MRGFRATFEFPRRERAFLFSHGHTGFTRHFGSAAHKLDLENLWSRGPPSQYHTHTHTHTHTHRGFLGVGTGLVFLSPRLPRHMMQKTTYSLEHVFVHQSISATKRTKAETVSGKSAHSADQLPHAQRFVGIDSSGVVLGYIYGVHVHEY